MPYNPELSDLDVRDVAAQPAQRQAPGPNMEATAQAALTGGWIPLPVAPAGKKPASLCFINGGWKARATAHPPTADDIAAWFPPGGRMGIGTIIPEGACALDVDVPSAAHPNVNADKQRAALESIMDSLGGLPGYATVNGGRRYLMHDRGKLACANLSDAGLEFKRPGCFIVIPPTPGYVGDALPSVCDLPAMPPDVAALFGDGARKAAARIPDIIKQGGRHAALVSYLGGMRHRGATVEEMTAAGLAFNRGRCRPNLKESDVRKTAADIAARYAPATATTPHAPGNFKFNHTDLGAAERLAVAQGARFRFCKALGGWLTWNDGRWQSDENGAAIHDAARQVVRALHAQAAATEDDATRTALAKFALRSEDEKRQRALIASAQTLEPHPISASAFDADPWLLNCRNGTFDLQRGELREHDPAALCTKIAGAAYDPQAKAPRWLRFLDETMLGDVELIDFLRRGAGYSLTGDTSERRFFLLVGTGANGKSSFLEALRYALGAYAVTTPFTTFLAKRSDGPSNDLAALAGARMVVAKEANPGRRFDEALIKSVTGRDRVSARFFYREFFEFDPQFKLWLACNSRPRVQGTDDSMWDRVCLVPFNATFGEGHRERRLLEALRAEGDGILSWAYQGYQEWAVRGLDPPDGVRAATADYRHEQDNVGSFLADACTVTAGAMARSGALYTAYRGWCERAGEYPLRINDFVADMQRRGFERVVGHGNVRLLRGVGLVDVEGGDPNG